MIFFYNKKIKKMANEMNGLINYLYWINTHFYEAEKRNYYYRIFKRNPEEILNEERNMKKILRKARNYDKTNKKFRNP